jgi:DNA polymerase III subunit epsilon
VITRLAHLRPTRPLMFVDVETTGLDVASDRVIELALVRFEPSRDALPDCFLFNPGRAIPPSSSFVHGITDEHVRGRPTFELCAPGLLEMLDGCDLAGFGVGFDLAMLTAEFARAGLTLRLKGRAVLDALRLFTHFHPRTLAAAVRRYRGVPHSAEHNALADALASAAVLDSMVEQHRLSADPALLHRELNDVDVGGRFRHAGPEIVFNFGRYRGKAIEEIAASDPSYLRWLVRQGFLLEDARRLIIDALRPSEGPPA